MQVHHNGACERPLNYVICGCRGDGHCHQSAVMTELSPSFVDGKMLHTKLLKEILKVMLFCRV